MTTEREIRAILDDIKDPCSVAAAIPMGLDEMGIVKSVTLGRSGHVEIALRLTSPVCEMIGYMRSEAIARISALPGVCGVSVSHDSGLDWDHDMIAPAAQARRESRLAVLQAMLRAVPQSAPAPAS